MRLEGRSKAGFYPTPITIVETITSHIRLNGSRHCRLLDPCCGTGEPLEHIARTFNIKGSYGVELDRQRAELSRQRLTKVVHESYTNLRTPEKAYSLLFLNPPY
ncbi:SAM-dependent DNA methyltransferase, partial [Candidatus Pacearchaeota archaeon]|nr:SAM-dependent DNA methyltransferase [Candidatus Pacearchaeota archaeon]